MKKNQNLPANDHVVRYVPFSKLRRDADENVVGILGAAFELRNKESYLSVTWLEYSVGKRIEQIAATVQAFRASNIKVGGKSGFAIGRVDVITQVCAKRNHKIRIVYEPMEDNKAHCAVRRFPRDDVELLELLATGEWSELVMNSSITKV